MLKSQILALARAIVQRNFEMKGRRGGRSKAVSAAKKARVTENTKLSPFRLLLIKYTVCPARTRARISVTRLAVAYGNIYPALGCFSHTMTFFNCKIAHSVAIVWHTEINNNT